MRFVFCDSMSCQPLSEHPLLLSFLSPLCLSPPLSFLPPPSVNRDCLSAVAGVEEQAAAPSHFPAPIKMMISTFSQSMAPSPPQQEISQREELSLLLMAGFLLGNRYDIDEDRCTLEEETGDPCFWGVGGLSMAGNW